MDLVRLEAVGVGVGAGPGLHNLLRNDLRRSEAIWLAGHRKMIGFLWYLHGNGDTLLIGEYRLWLTTHFCAINNNPFLQATHRDACAKMKNSD